MGQKGPQLSCSSRERLGPKYRKPTRAIRSPCWALATCGAARRPPASAAMNALRPRWWSTDSIPVGSIIVPPLHGRIAGSLAEAGQRYFPIDPIVRAKLKRTGMRLGHLLNGELEQEGFPCAIQGGAHARARVESGSAVR